MAELRRDLRGEAVIVSPGRAERPYDFRATEQDRRARCPFCARREDQTPPEVDAERDEDGWRVRVVPNRYPAFPRAPEREGDAFGVHEVIIETPEHGRSIADFDADEATTLMRVWQRRLLAAREDKTIAFASIFKNHGARAGASLEHAHSQLMAIPFVPRKVAGEVEAWRDGSAARRLEADLGAAEFAVARDGGTRAFAPSFARFPWECWILPEAAEARFEETPGETLESTARLLLRVLGAMNTLLGRPDYHLVVSTAPFRLEGAEAYRWRIELFPRLTQVAGFEWATDVFVNQTPPETTAHRLRTQIDAT